MTATPTDSAPRPTPARAERFHDLDALRAVAMFLGILLHVCMFLMPELSEVWRVQDADAAAAGPFYGTLLSAIHGFRMPVFFLLSGFFTALLWQRRSLRAVAMQRLRRIGIPLAGACLTVLPLFLVFWIIVTGDEIPLWAFPLVWLRDFAHLWFLWYLLLLAGGFCAAARLGLEFRSRAWLWAPPALSLPLQFAMREPVFGPDNASAVFISLVPSPALLAYYALFYIFGISFYLNGIVIRRWWTVALLPAAPAFLVGMHYLYENPLRLANAPVQTAYTWLMCFGLMGLFRLIAARERFWVRYMSDASYWMYLAHLPLVFITQALLVKYAAPAHYHLKFLLVCVIVTLVLLATYQLGVRYTIIGRTLNGPRVRRTGAPA